MKVSLRTFHNYHIDRGVRGSPQLEIEYYGKTYSTFLNTGDNSIDVFKVKGAPEIFLVYSQSRWGGEDVYLIQYEIGAFPGLSDETGEKGLIGDPTWEVYFDEFQAEEVLGKGWEDKTALRNAKILYRWL